MKKLLLVSAIVLGSASLASAQASEPVAAAKTTKATKTKAVPAQKQKEIATANQLAGARVSNAAVQTKAPRLAAKKTKAPTAAKN